jgi:hypothetical protein
MGVTIWGDARNGALVSTCPVCRKIISIVFVRREDNPHFGRHQLEGGAATPPQVDCTIMLLVEGIALLAIMMVMLSLWYTNRL